MNNTTIKKPSLFLHITEVFRATIELIRGYFFLRNYRGQNLGNGRPVLVIPGLLSTDLSITFLRNFFQKLGFIPYKWGLGRNLGRLESVQQLIRKVQGIHAEKQQKVMLVGWSMGGIFAREIAKQIPECVENVMTIGSPFGNVHAPNHAKWVFDLFNDESTLDTALMAQIHEPAPVPTTAFYSKKDGIVPWEACREHQETATHRNIEISSSHLGMGVNPDVFKAILVEIKALNSVLIKA